MGLTEAPTNAPTTVEILRALVAKFGITAIAAAAGTSTGTLTVVVRTGEEPDREHARANLRRCADVNRDATTRRDLRFVG